MESNKQSKVPLRAIMREWGRIGIIGFGGPPAHIALLRERCVEKFGWISAEEFESAIAAVNLLPGPASTQLAIYLAWRLRRSVGALLGGLCFIAPGLAIILLLSSIFLAGHPPIWVLGIAAGAGAAVPAVALHAASGLAPASWKRVSSRRARQVRWVIYALVAAISAACVGPLLVIALLACGIAEVIAERPRPSNALPLFSVTPLFLFSTVAISTMGAVAWVAFKVGALSYGGGFVIIPLMQHDAVTTYHWMSQSQFLNAVALGQITPGPVVQTVAVVGYAAAGLAGGLFAALIAFGPSFLFVLIGGPSFQRISDNQRLQAFLTGAGAASIGAIAGSAIPLGLSLQHVWQAMVLLFAGLWLLVFKRSVVLGLVLAGCFGAFAAILGAPVH